MQNEYLSRNSTNQLWYFKTCFKRKRWKRVFSTKITDQRRTRRAMGEIGAKTSQNPKFIWFYGHYIQQIVFFRQNYYASAWSHTSKHARSIDCSNSLLLWINIKSCFSENMFYPIFSPIEIIWKSSLKFFKFFSRVLDAKKKICLCNQLFFNNNIILTIFNNNINNNNFNNNIK